MFVEKFIDFLSWDFLTKIWIEGNLKWFLALFITSLFLLAFIISIFIIRRWQKNNLSRPYLKSLLISHYIIFFVVCFLLFFLNNSYHLKKGLFLEPVYRLSDNEKIIALTFDDGPHPQYTPEILNILSQYSINATFFYLGKNIKKYPDVVLKTATKGHDIGSHSYSHNNMRWMWLSDINTEVVRVEKELERLELAKPVFFRPPHGGKSVILERYLLQNGYHIVTWNLSPKDWKALNPDILLGRLLRFVKPGSIILLHHGPNAVAILPAFIEEMQKRGYRFVKIGDVIKGKSLKTARQNDGG